MALDRNAAPDSRSGRGGVESTTTLLVQVRDGDERAREELVRRLLPRLRRWAHGRLPQYARDLADTDDLVQVALLRALDRVSEFEPRREGAFLAYLRRIVLNSVRDEIRRAGRRPLRGELAESLSEPGPSLVEKAIGREVVAAYEAALSSLPEEQQEAVIMRVEFGYTYPEIAEALGKRSANAARMEVSRALLRVAEVMGHAG
ncbi:MAG TPA: sigma-70 family RNA polymerase sigma factor [Thermoanaerobaculia bacterium]|nr:sigma-70 family RNA polymerase sigma factor [Thermoanaerobaculia bacterium]